MVPLSIYRQWSKPLQYCILAVFLFLVSIVMAAVVTTGQASAYSPEGDYIKPTTDKWLQYRALIACYGAAPTGAENSLKDVNAGKWLDVSGPDRDVNIGYLNKNGGDKSCGSGGDVLNWHKALGFAGDGQAIFCSIPNVGGNNSNNNKRTAKDCNESSGKFKLNSDPKDNFIKAVKAIPASSGLVYDPPGWTKYYIYKKSLETWCGGGTALAAKGLGSNSKGAVSIHYVDQTTGKITTGVNYKIVEDEDHNVPDIWQGKDGGKCGDLAKGTRDNSAAYSTKIISLYNEQVIKSWKDAAGDSLSTQIPARGDCSKSYIGDAPVDDVKYVACEGSSGMTTVGAMIDRCGNRNELKGARPIDERIELVDGCLRAFLPADIYTQISNARVDVTAEEAASDVPENPETNSCAVDGIGWVVCPVMNFIGDLNDKAYGFLSDTFLQIEPDLLNEDTEAAWKSFRDIANILFVIAFLVIIYSQITGGGISNYGLKKMLPKLIIAAILVNTSFILCKLAIDVSNIIGNSIPSFFDLTFSTTADDTSTTANTNLPLWKDAIGAALIAGTAAVGLVLALSLGIPGILALIVIVLILVARKAAIILLVVISPLAFVAYLLPNTEQWFKKWWKLFSSLLILYPVIGIVFGASALAARIINNGDPTMQLVALGVSVLPLFAVPVLLKGSMSALGTVGAKLSGLSDKANRAAVGSSKASYNKSAFARGLADRKAGKAAYRTQKYAEGVSGSDTSIVGRARRRASRGITGRTFTNAGDFAQERAVGSAVAASHKATNEAVEHEEGLLSDIPIDGPDGLMSEMGKGTVERQAAVMRRIAKIGGEQHVQSAYNHLMQAKADGVEGAGDVQQLAADALLSRKPAGVGSSEANGLRTGTLSGSGGYMESLKTRVAAQKMGAKDYAAMGTDDLHRLAELSQKGDLSPDDIKHISDMHAAIEADETLKGSLTGERQALFGSIVVGSGPMKADGTTPRKPLTKL